MLRACIVDTRAVQIALAWMTEDLLLHLQEVEAMLVAFVEKGAGVEADILASVVALLPPEVKEQLPEEVSGFSAPSLDYGMGSR